TGLADGWGGRSAAAPSEQQEPPPTTRAPSAHRPSGRQELATPLLRHEDRLVAVHRGPPPRHLAQGRWRNGRTAPSVRSTEPPRTGDGPATESPRTGHGPVRERSVPSRRARGALRTVGAR